MSETGRPRRSAATHSSKVWAPLMSNKSGGEEDVYDEPTETTRKRTNSTKSPAPRAARGKKTKLSESAGEELFQEEPVAPPLPVPEPVTVSASPKNVRSPKKPPPKKGTATIVTSDAADLQRMQEEFDRQNVTAPVDDELEEEEVTSPPVVKASKSRGRPVARTQLPPSLTGMDDPKDADYVMEEPEVKKRAPPAKPRINIPQPAGPRTIVMKAPPPRQTVSFRPGMTVAPRVVFPNRLPTIINGGPRVVQPRYVSRPVPNTDVLTKPMPIQSYELPINVMADIERLTKEVKDSGNPTVIAAFELVQIVREELDRLQKAYNDANHFYHDYVDRLQTAALTHEEQSTKRISMLESEVNTLRVQLKKCSAIAHQKLLKSFEENQQSPQKMIPTSQYVVMAEQGSLEQPHPTNYLVQEEEYPEQPGAYYTHEAVIQEASKEVDNMV